MKTKVKESTELENVVDVQMRTEDEPKVLAHIYETTDYDQFNIIRGDRPIDRRRVERLKALFKKGYLMDPSMVNERKDIIKGKHRLTAVKELAQEGKVLPFRYYINEGYGVQEMRTLSFNEDGWSVRDALDSYIDTDDTNYVKLKRFMDTYPDFKFDSAKILLSLKSDSSTKSVDPETGMKTDDFKEGKFSIPNYERSCEIAEMLLYIKPYFEGFAKRAFVRAILKSLQVEEFDFRYFVSKVALQPHLLTKAATVKGFLDTIEYLYNYRKHNKINIRFQKK